MTLGSGRPMSAAMQAYDVRHYTLRHDIRVERKSIAGSATIQFEATAPLAFFERKLGPLPRGQEKLGAAETPHLGNSALLGGVTVAKCRSTRCCKCSGSCRFCRPAKSVWPAQKRRGDDLTGVP